MPSVVSFLSNIPAIHYSAVWQFTKYAVLNGLQYREWAINSTLDLIQCLSIFFYPSRIGDVRLLIIQHIIWTVFIVTKKTTTIRWLKRGKIWEKIPFIIALDYFVEDFGFEQNPIYYS